MSELEVFLSHRRSGVVGFKAVEVCLSDSSGIGDVWQGSSSMLVGDQTALAENLATEGEIHGLEGNCLFVFWGTDFVEAVARVGGLVG